MKKLILHKEHGKNKKLTDIENDYKKIKIKKDNDNDNIENLKARLQR